ncbi:MAG TPA: NAD(P)H-dependent oxidoreductase subunit E [Myxococcales bacterium]|nr:NAD(P)H-dependent oxidoreductase subunit E [Myxococcales bacterium]HIN86821.1 NAD(P)H-dependent oxidoreductase subunit E [Myxococcales bacterium]
MTLIFTEENEKQFQTVVARYPSDHTRAALLPVLWIAQRQWGYLSHEVMTYVAERLELHPSEVMNTATFYTLFNKEKVGKFHIQVCTNLSCWLRGSDDIVSTCKEKLGIGVGETTADGKFTLNRVECLASCGTAPMMQVNDEYHENLSCDQVATMIDTWSKESGDA